MSIQSKGYIANEHDITNLTAEIIGGLSAAESGRATYLNALVATAKDGLGFKPGAARGKRPKITEESTEAQLAALGSVHEKFYAAVLAAAQGHADNPAHLNRLTNFARTAFYAVRTWVRVGNDLARLAAGKVTKASLKVPGGARARPPSPARLKATVERESKRLVAAVLGLAEADKESAVSELQLLIGQLATQLEALGMPTIKRTKAGDSQRAAASGSLLRVGSTMFVPTDTQVARQMARPV